jgi:hypothetical protein
LSVPKKRYIGEMFVCSKGKIYKGRCLSVTKERYIGEMFVCSKRKIYKCIGGDVCLSQRKDIWGGAMYILIFSPLTETPQSNETETW